MTRLSCRRIMWVVANPNISRMKGADDMIMPYLNFTGECEEAFNLYRRAFDGQAPMLAHYSDAPKNAYPNLDSVQRNKVMHGQMMLTETGGISGADAIWPVEKGSAINIHVICADVEKAQKASMLWSCNSF